MYGGCFCVVMVGVVGVGGGLVYYVMYVLYVCYLVWYVMCSWGFSVCVVGWSKKCNFYGGMYSWRYWEMCLLSGEGRA